MATKDEWFDPSVNFDSESDSEMNNVRSKLSSSPSPPSSPLSDFILNDLHEKGRGPQADNDDAKGATGGSPETRQCSCCPDQVTKLYEGTKFQCHRHKQFGGDESKGEVERAKHRICYQCATDHRRCKKCRVHGFALDAFAMRSPPVLAWSAGN